MRDLKGLILEKLKLDKNLLDKNNDAADPYDPSTWEIGDILAGTAGYSMCLPRFYKIIKRTAKSFTVQRIPGKIVSGHRNGQWQEMPDESAPLSKEQYTGRITKYNHVKIDGTTVHLWNGEPLHGDDMD